MNKEALEKRIEQIKIELLSANAKYHDLNKQLDEQKRLMYILEGHLSECAHHLKEQQEAKEEEKNDK